MAKCIILAGGPAAECAQVQVERKPDDLVIGCDAGCALAERLGLRPDLAVGDFDSFTGTLDPSIPVMTVPTRKDDTDTLLGLRVGLERGYRDFLIVGGFGGRLDHTVANLQALHFLCAQGARGEIRADVNCAWAVRNGTLTLPKMAGWHLSVFAWGGQAQGVNLSGVAYPLTDGTLTPDFPIGVSNEFTDAVAQISVREGTLLIIASQEKIA